MKTLTIALLTSLTLLGQDAPETKKKIRVAIYDFKEKNAAGPQNLTKCLGGEEFEVKNATAQEIRDGILKDFDALMIPGGSASSQSKELEEKGLESIKKFVEGGGGYVGFCAGSYLATCHYKWSLGILNAKVIDTAHWARGTGTVKIKLSEEGRKMLGAKDEVVEVYYGQGPLLGPGDDKDLPAFKSLATYETEIAKKGAPEGVMKGTVAVACAEFGKGRVLCFSPHPEKTEGLGGIVVHAARWVTRR